jgi:hypothetical protein
MAVDWIKGWIANTRSLNRCVYALDNPLYYLDPWGLTSVPNVLINGKEVSTFIAEDGTDYIDPLTAFEAVGIKLDPMWTGSPYYKSNWSLKDEYAIGSGWQKVTKILALTLLVEPQGSSYDFAGPFIHITVKKTIESTIEDYF